MLTVIIAFIIGSLLLSSPTLSTETCYNYKDYERKQKAGCLVFILIIIVTAVALLSFTNFKDDWEVSYRQEIYASNDIFGSRGNVFRTTVDGYFFYYYRAKGGYMLGSLEARKYTIIEDEENTPYIAHYVRRPENLYTVLFGIPFPPKKYEIHVPKGSVVQSHKYNLSN